MFNEGLEAPSGLGNSAAKMFVEVTEIENSLFGVSEQILKCLTDEFLWTKSCTSWQVVVHPSMSRASPIHMNQNPKVLCEISQTHSLYGNQGNHP